MAFIIGKFDPIYCTQCEMFVNQQAQWEEHLNGRKHRKKFNRQSKGAAAGNKNKGIDVPSGTVLLLEQTALWQDAVTHYLSTLFARAALKSRLWSGSFSPGDIQARWFIVRGSNMPALARWARVFSVVLCGFFHQLQYPVKRCCHATFHGGNYAFPQWYTFT